MPGHLLTTAAGVNPGAATAPGRAVNTDITPNTTKATLVMATVSITAARGQHGRVTAVVGAAANPTTEYARAAISNTDADSVNASSNILEATLTFIVPAGFVYRLNTTNVAGTPTISLLNAYEMAL